MVKLHRPVTPEPLIVKRGRTRSLLRPRTHCIVCGCTLASYHRPGELFCQCHAGVAYVPACDPNLDRRVLDHLAAAYPYPLRLAASLGVSPVDAYGHQCIKAAVARWRGRGVPIRAVKGIGYRLGA